ncbi:MAG: GNAT family N-acetyltransferase [Lachnospiraceae bacterium]|nr:GNAT family N-acetyltransferase [Lachnospiraceae bacterium]
MKLRKLKEKDAELMLEWMHDPFVVENLQNDFHTKTIEDCRCFIMAAQDVSQNMHLAIVNSEDEYMGTVSLKNITKENAEFAITIRRSAMGQGYSKFGMNEIIEIGVEELGLEEIYWFVDPNNERAIKFYDKNGYRRVRLKDDLFFQNMKKNGQFTEEQLKKYIWYDVCVKEKQI